MSFVRSVRAVRRGRSAALGRAVLAALGVSLVSMALGGRGWVATAASDPDADGELAKFLAYPEARTGCIRLDRDGIEGSACFDAHQLPKGTKEADPAKDYFTWQFTGGAAGSGGLRLDRVKVRLGSPSAEVFHWAPGEDRESEEARPVRLDLPFADALARFRLLAGRLHPATGVHFHHVSWQDISGKGLACCARAETGGITQWFVPENGSMTATIRIEAFYR